MSMEGYLREHPDAGEEDLREALAGNLCRCTGYLGIVEAVENAAREMKGEDVEGD
jgi:aerobic-type carbon monoxide dehydrogenase small subunit (CoxS/CutS family)